MEIKRCFVVDDLHRCIIDLLEQEGIRVDYEPTLERTEILERLPEYDALLIRSKTVIDKSFLKHAKKLKVIGRAGAGLDQIDETAVKELGIQLINAPEGNRTAVGEHAVGMLLAMMNNLHCANTQVGQRVWMREFNRGYEIEGKTVGIIGYGNMGKAFAKCLTGFNCEVIAFDKYAVNYTDKYATAVTFEELTQRADVISLHIPLTEDSLYQVDQRFFDQFKKPIWFINTARGKVTSLEALIDALDKGVVRGAALDVLENEKMPTYTEKEIKILENLVERENVIFTPHVAGWTFESHEKISQILAKKLLDLITN